MIKPQESYGMIKPQESYGVIKPQESYGMIKPRSHSALYCSTIMHVHNTYGTSIPVSSILAVIHIWMFQ